jgi:hypothetical protein
MNPVEVWSSSTNLGSFNVSDAAYAGLFSLLVGQFIVINGTRRKTTSVEFNINSGVLIIRVA